MGCVTCRRCPAETSMLKLFLFRKREASPMPKWNRNNWADTVRWVHPLDGPSVCCKELMDIFSCQMWQPVASKQLMVSHKYNSVSAVASGWVHHRVYFIVKSCLAWLPPAAQPWSGPHCDWAVGPILGLIWMIFMISSLKQMTDLLLCCPLLGIMPPHMSMMVKTDSLLKNKRLSRPLYKWVQVVKEYVNK